MRIFGLIGQPLQHSFSQKYFTSKFSKEHLTDSCEYQNFELKSIDELLPLLKNNRDIIGLNVTIPYKVQVMKILHELDGRAEQTGAVNTVQIIRGNTNDSIVLKGFNTDIVGFEKAVTPLLKADTIKALILGTGGASKAVYYVLKQLGIETEFVSRTTAQNVLSYQQLTSEIIKSSQLIVNTTPLGTFPDVRSCPPIPYHLLNENHILFDLVYNPEQTEFMRLGSLHHATVSNGYAMLVEQAEASWQIWNNYF